MLHLVTHPLILGAALEEDRWFEVTVVFVALCAIGFLVWQLWTTQRQYALELAEQFRLVSEEQEKANQAQLDREALARESQAKSEMLATLSQEIRAHLNGIIGSADLMLDNSLKPNQREHLTTLRASAESLHQSLNDVLDYSSIETGQIQIGHAGFDLRQPLIEVVETLSPLALLKDLELVLIVAPDVPLLVSGDAARLRQVLLNLMSNAVKFTASGRVVLRVGLPPGSSAVSLQRPTWLHFSVSDTGAGIPEEMQATIFDRSTKSGANSTRKFGGSGLELAISKRLVELMGGKIGARSLPEGGSEFWVDLALPADEVQGRAATALRDGLHVVVLDDLAASRVAASAMLTRLGIEHDATDTLAEAVVLLREALEEDALELVLLIDESVAKNGSEELARLLVDDATLRTTRIVLMLRDPDEGPPAGLSPSLTAVVRKPLLRADVMLEALRKARGTGGAKPSSSRAPFEAGGEAKPAIRREPSVLVVDDDKISRSVSSQLLQRLGCIVESAVSGAEAVERTQQTQFELIFMDCRMPEMDGFDATVKIRALLGSKAPPIVALTANTADPDRERCFAVGMCDFISKPVHKAELARVLKRWIQAPVGDVTPMENRPK